MKKFFSKILISLFVLGFFLAPVSLNIVNNQKISVSEKKIFAQGSADFVGDPNRNLVKAVEAARAENSEEDFGCSANPLTWFSGCIVLLFYWIATALASAVTVSATLLDWFIFYSTNSSAYKSNFIEAAWGTVRDIANIFFLLGLLYVAIKIAVGSGVSEAKGQIAKIIIMALLVNFSLFATQVIIDASNILTKVFYNQVEPLDKAGNKLEKDTEPKSISVVLANKFQPQNILNDRSQNNLGVKFLIVLIVIALCLYMIYLFLSVAFLFLGRVVSLWISMIFAPIAFMSRGIGAKIPGLSWGEWLSTLISSAMMAPIFVFFLYIILLLGDAVGLSQITANQNLNWLHTIVSVVVPFAIIFTLLMKAKALAVKYSGDIGNTVSKIGFAATALTLGGAAAGGAAIGRNTFGAVAKYSKTEYDTTRGKDMKIRENLKEQWNKKDFWGKAGMLTSSIYGGGAAKIIGKGLAATTAERLTTKTRDNTGKVQQRTKLGDILASSKDKKHEAEILQKKISEKAGDIHASKDAKWSDLNDDQKKVIKNSLNEDLIAKEVYGVAFAKLTNREEIKAVKVAAENATTNRLDPEKIDFVLRDKNQQVVKRDADGINGADHIIKSATKEGKTWDNIKSEAVYSAANGSWDIRDISKLSSKQLTMVIGLLAGIAGILRAGMKKVDIDPGTGQKDFLKDLSSVISTAVKSAGAGSFGGGGGGGHDDHGHGGGGHDDHGHGGGGHH